VYRRLAILPARGGSKRIVGKNTKLFCGQPMISYILNSALNSELFSKIHISTECDDVKACVESLGFEVDFMRPQNLSGDHIPIMDVLKFVVQAYLNFGERFDEVWMLMPCSPLITESILVDAANQYGRYSTKNPLLAIREYSAPIEWSLGIANDQLLCSKFNGLHNAPSQTLAKSYHDAGSFIVFSEKDILMDDVSIEKTLYRGYVLRKSRAIDIDDDEDWLIAEALFNEIFNRNSK
jgi:CMP-N-acetylneuraminic acid synthetase